ncbi:hypothetical protein J31TS4_32770 [Paenibacillus sp. J31TS4]|uniref:hypothetical protein n=1 Tax=Paenibacillus sp. J31TS4 TaxID=2807195 RepID=UPI001B1612CA|nr:hypothetical protein [Paenibacillus sp. J31TS4]GIP39997.1 hypothetical protein J31TS4_32770 [Paenibacillus sp. J31TS4]
MNGVFVTLYSLGFVLLLLRDWKRMKSRTVSRGVMGILYGVTAVFLLCMVFNIRLYMPTHLLNLLLGPIGEAILGGVYYAETTD